MDDIFSQSEQSCDHWKTGLLESIATYEAEPIKLQYINSNIIWKLATLAKERAQSHKKPIVIDITSSGGQVYLHLALKDGTIPDNDHWITRKKNTTLRFGMSSYYMGRKCMSRKSSIQETMKVDEKDFAVHGGSVPIRIANVDGLWGALTISGLAAVEDHKFALNLLMDVKKEIESGEIA